MSPYLDADFFCVCGKRLMWSGSQTNRKEQKRENAQILKDRYMRPCMKKHFFFKRLRTNQNNTFVILSKSTQKLFRVRYNLSRLSVMETIVRIKIAFALKLFSYLLFSTVYLTFEQFVTVLAQREKSTLANVCLGVRFGSQVGYLGSKKFKVLHCEIFGIFCVINPSRSFGKIQLKT